MAEFVEVVGKTRGERMTRKDTTTDCTDCEARIRAEVWKDIEKIINGMSNPIDTMKIIIEKLEEQNRQKGYTAKEMADIGQALGDGLRKGLGGLVMSRENAIEWLNGQDRVTVSFSQGKFINKIKRLAEKNPEVEIVAENKDGSICAHLPLKYIKINPPRVMSEEQRELARERLLKYKES